MRPKSARQALALALAYFALLIPGSPRRAIATADSSMHCALEAAAFTVEHSSIHRTLRQNWEPLPVTNASPCYWHGAVASASSRGYQYYVGGITANQQAEGLIQQYSTSAHTWRVDLPPQPIPTFGSVVVWLNDTIVVCGGFTSPAPPWVAINAVQVFDPQTETWSNGPAMPIARGGCSGAIIEGVLYLVGGSESDDFPSDSPAYQFDPASGLWSSLPEVPSGARGLVFGTACAYQNELYVTGDYRGYRDCYKYSPATGTWTVLASTPDDVGGQSPVLAASPVGIYCVGGGAGFWTDFYDASYYYLPETDQWFPLDEFINPGRCAHAGMINIGQFSVFGGADTTVLSPPPHETLELFAAGVILEPSIVRGVGEPNSTVAYTLKLFNNTWVTLSVAITLTGNSWEVVVPALVGPIAPGTAELVSVIVSVPSEAQLFFASDQVQITARDESVPTYFDRTIIETRAVSSWQHEPPALIPGRAMSAAASDGTVLRIFGGFNGSVYLDETWLFTPQSSAWIQGANVLSPRAQCAGVSLGPNAFYVIGGFDGTNYLSAVDLYRPSVDSWDISPQNLPLPLAGVAAVTYQNHIYSFGGTTGLADVDHTYQYDPALNHWSIKAPLPRGAKHSATASASNDTIYLIGGWPNLNHLEAYTPATNTWTILPPIPEGRHSAGAVIVDSLLIVFGGGQSWTALDSTWIYETTSQLWTAGPSLHEARLGSVSGLVSNNLLTGLGLSASGPTDTFESLRIAQQTTPTISPTVNPTLTPTALPTALPNQCRLLLVDDDANDPDVRGYYTEVLDTLNYSEYDAWDIANEGAPTVTDLAPYWLVLWFTGARAAGLTSEDETTLAIYLESAGRLVLSSQDYLCPAGITDFARDYLQLRSYIGDVLDYEVIGRQGDPIGDGLGPFYLYPPANFGPLYCDQLFAEDQPEVSTPFIFVESGLANAVLVNGNDYTSLFLAFPLEAIYDPASRAAVIQRILALFCQEPEPAVTLTPRTAALWICPLQEQELAASLYNFTDSNLSFSLSYTGDWQQIGPQSLGPVAPYSSVDFTVRVTAPADAGPSTVVPLTIQAVASTNPDLVSSIVIAAHGSYSGWELVADIPHPRVDAVIVERQGLIYAVAGYDEAAGGPVTALDIFDPGVGTWLSGPAMPAPGISSGGDGVVIGDILYIPGDLDEPYLYTYSFSQQSWSKQLLQQEVPAVTAYETLTLNGLLYRLGGQTWTSILNDLWYYDPQTLTWTERSAMNIPRCHFQSWTTGGLIYVAGGISVNNEVTDTCEFYDPDLNTWTLDSSRFAFLPVGVWGAADALLEAEPALWLAGGFKANSSDCATTSAYVFVPGSNVWLEYSPLLTSTGRTEAATVSGLPFITSGLSNLNGGIQGIAAAELLFACAIPTMTHTQSPIPTVTLTPTPPPTSTRTATITPTFPAAPTATPTFTATSFPPGVILQMPAHSFSTGERCWLDAVVTNPQPVSQSYAFLAALDVYGTYFWYPSWGVDAEITELTLYGRETRRLELVPSFQFPGGAGSANGLQFLGAITDPDLTRVFGEIGVWGFSYSS